ncbi:hypothetical protein [Pseudomonas atacamensis]|uniref:hypothetical protein n=1 Tax=Pseudomonas atacamensis TaxID=2565368 RepID=UPI003208CA23
MSTHTSHLNFISFKKVFIPLFQDNIMCGDKINLSLKYKLPNSMMLKGDPCDFAHALPSTYKKESMVFKLVRTDEDWIVTLKLFHLIRSLEGKKKCRDIATGFYFLLDSLPAFKKPWEVTNSDFLRALKKNNLSLGVKYRAGSGLANIGKTYKKYNLSPENIKYVQNPYTRPPRSTKELLPDLEACTMVAESFRFPQNGFETIVSSAFALLNYAPSRSSEIVTLSHDCITSLDGFGLRFPKPAKNGKSVVKRSPCVEFEEVIEEAVHKLIDFGKSARDASAWYKENKVIYIPKGLEHLRDQKKYNIQEALAIIGYERSDGVYSQKKYSNRSNSLPAAILPPGLGRLFQSDASNFYRHNEKILLTDAAFISETNLYAWVIKNLSSTFPFVDGVSNVEYKNCLFVYPYSSKTPNLKIYWQCHYVPCFFSTIKLQSWLGKLFFRGREREDLSLGTHTMRHLLNTLAQSKHIDQRLIAMWSGRNSVEQNSAYDHRTALEKIDLIDENAIGAGFEFGGFLDDLYELEHKQTGVSTEQFFKTIIGSLHVTELGLCRHNYNSGPCPNVFQCIDCSEHCFKRGDEKSLLAAHRMVEKLQPVIAAAQIAVDKGEPGAEKFLNSHKNKILRYKKQIEICSDTSVPGEALCALTPESPTDNIVSKAIVSRALNADQVKQQAHKHGRVLLRSFDSSVINTFESLMDSWTVNNGLPTWENVCSSFSANYNTLIRQQAILDNDSMRRAYEDLGKRMLSTNLIKRDSSLRWYWNNEYIASQILKSWEFELHGCPTLPKIAQQFKTNFSYAKVTLVALEKNIEIRSQLLKKRKYLHATGLIFLSTHGALVCERKSLTLERGYQNIYECFSQFARDWGIEDGLPVVETVLAKFSKKTGFTFNRTYIFSDKKLLKEFNYIRKKSEETGLIKFNRARIPIWNIDGLILSCFTNEGHLEIDCDTPTIYENILTRFPDIKLTHQAISKSLKSLRRECK